MFAATRTYAVVPLSAQRFRVDSVELCRIEIFRRGISYLSDSFADDDFDHNDCLQLFHAEVFHLPGV